MIQADLSYKMAPVTRLQSASKAVKTAPKAKRPRIVERIQKAERAGLPLEGIETRPCVCEKCSELRAEGGESDYLFICSCGETAAFVKVENDFCTYSQYFCPECFSEDFDPDLFGDEDVTFKVNCDQSYEYAEFAGTCPAHLVPMRVRTKMLDGRFPIVVDRFSDLSIGCAMRERGFGLAITAADLKKYPIHMDQDSFVFTEEHP